MSSKYLVLFKTYWQNSWVYPVSFWMWRLRQFLSTFGALTVWLAIYHWQHQAFGYSQNDMISYILLTGFLQSMILATQLGGLAQDIYTGEMSNLFVKPVRVFGSFITREFSDKSLNFLFTILETIILLFIFKPTITIPNSLTVFLFFVSVILGAILLFLIMLLFGVMGFWSPDTWAPRFLFYIFIDFTAGKLYPLNIFPQFIQNILFWTPFPYLSYVQTQIFLNHYSLTETVHTLVMMAIWNIAIYAAFRYFWQKGLKEYGALGH